MVRPHEFQASWSVTVDVRERGTRLLAYTESSWLCVANSVVPFSFIFLFNITGEAQNPGNVCFSCQMPLGHHTCAFSSSTKSCTHVEIRTHHHSACRAALKAALNQSTMGTKPQQNKQAKNRKELTYTQKLFSFRHAKYFMKGTKFTYSCSATISEVSNRWSSTPEKLELQNTSLFFYPVDR